MTSESELPRRVLGTPLHASSLNEDTDVMPIPYGKLRVARWLCSWLVAFLVILWLPSLKPDWFSNSNWFYYFGLILVGSLLVYFAYLLFTNRPGVVLDSKGIRPLLDLRGPEHIYWTELTGAKPVVRTGSGRISKFSGVALRYVDLEFRDAEKFFDRLGTIQRRYRAPYYRSKGIPYAIFVEYLKPSPEEIAETIKRYIAKYGDPSRVAVTDRKVVSESQ